jgi:GH35 family endo-1,4-beta-xylanase/peptidoglycan/xylan/chitin deacetylase (PgdA/CDA1 family)
MNKILISFLAVFVLTLHTAAQFGNPPWKGKKCAIVITYDDGYNQQLDNAIPVLDSLGLKATFYLSASFPAVRNRLDEWRNVARKGYELGNHTLYHPCMGNIKGREWVKPGNDLSGYTVQRMEDEIRMANVFLQSLDGKTKRTFAFPCSDMKIGDSSFINGMKNDLVAARAVRGEMHKINEVDPYNVDCYMVNNNSFEQMKQWVDKAMQTNSLLVILFHGVGGGNSLDVSLPAHRELLNYIKQNEKDIYVAPMVEVMEHVKEWQERDKQAKLLQKATNDDYQNMLGQLNITSIRPGANGNDSKAANAANYDESKANPFPDLPDALSFRNGKKVTSIKDWWKRRKELTEDFDREIYGRVPANTPGVSWELMGTSNDLNGNIPVITKRLIGHVDNSSYPAVKVDIQLTLTVPANVDQPVPVVMEFGFVFPPGFRFPANTPAPAGPTWQQQCLAKGWGYAIMVPTSVQADNGAGLTQGIIGLMNKGQYRKPDDWGALRAWAWGASRALDYFETDKSVDAKHIAIEGHSRYGKAALVTLAYDPRFATAFVSSSGEGGAKLHRRNAGEIVENVASSGEYHWMAGNFIKYAGPLNWGNMPVDSHELIAMCAPRPVFISAGEKGDGWVDARGMFMAAVAAGPVYKLLGKKDLGTAEFPKAETTLINGEIAFRQHAGGHTPAPNWPTFIQFASRYFKTIPPVIKPIENIKGLKDYYKDYFPIGVAVSPRSLKTDEAQLILQQFNSMTPENAMKMGPIHPGEHEYNWSGADSIAAFAKRNDLKLRGHTLCWHNQIPDWLFKDSTGNVVTKEVLLQRLKEHITAVVKRYKGTVYAWDVVNEVISDKPDEYFRPSLWYKICGEEFVAKAFQYAHEADPDALLFYNDYNEIDPVKRQKIIRMVKGLKDAGIPINGVGLQGHWAVNEPSKEQLEKTLEDFSQLGLKLQITELDISVYPKEHNAREARPEDAITVFSKEKESKQMDVYKMCFELFRKFKNVISGVTFWNISDRSSWLDDFPVRNRKDHPLLFDKDLKPKKAFWKVVEF